MAENTTINPASSVAEIRAALESMRDPRMLAVNEKRGNDHAVNLTKLRGLAKQIKTNQDLAIDLWNTGDSDARLLALLICKPKAFGLEELDAMLREAVVPKVQEWLVSYVVKKSPHCEALRLRWFDDLDPVVASAGWELTVTHVSKNPGLLDLPRLLETIESEMKDAPERLQWAMNHTLAEIGISHAEHRERALAIGEKLQVLADYPTPPGCTSPFAPIWINYMVGRQA
ncbi:DNA alkylation repair protein [Paeniglutamicibacter sp. NPDC091659]|uniref:DNA alkylation repair protein n=1 Tax=Paeniglutamicibacter sp. NPDC091659 TaxID=3364389 RepID=UPI0038197D2B